MSHRSLRWWLALALLLAACTSGEPVATTTTFEPGAAVTTRPPGTEAPAPERSTTTTTLPPLPVRADPDDVAADPIARLRGFSVSEPTTKRSDQLREALVLYIGSAFEGFTVASLGSADGDEVAVASTVPIREFRGDPGLPLGLADLLAFDPTAEVEEVGMSNGVAYTFTQDDESWWVGATNTHVFITLGGPEPARAVMDELLESGADAYLWQRGDCLHLGRGGDFGVPYAPFGDIDVVPCDGLHTHEVVHSERLSDGPDAPFPRGDLAKQRDAACDEAYESHMGTLRSRTTIELISYMPDAVEWAEGDRYLACMVHAVDDSGATVELTDALAGTGPEHPFTPEPGDCYDDSFAEQVNCGAPHLFEVIEVLVHPDPSDAPFPTGVDGWFADRCAEAVAAAEIDVEESDLSSQTPRLSRYEWERGVRNAMCWIGARSDEGGLEKVIGSFTGSWQRIGRDGVSA